MLLSLEEHISKLLLTHECIIVPGFGAFITNNKPARLIGNTLIPPGKYVSFNKSLHFNDGLLISSIASARNLSYSEASSFINSITQEWLIKLNKNGRLELNGVGLILQSGENLNFQPSEFNFSINSFGLEPIAVQTYQKTVIPIIPLVLKDLQYNRRRIIWISAAIAAMSIGILISVYLTNFHSSTSGQYPQPKEANLGVVETDLVSPKPESSSVLKMDNLVKEMNGSKMIENSSLQMQFYIIGGSFSKKGNAEKLLKELKAKGYNPELLNSSNGFYRVAYYSNQDSTATDIKLKEIRQSNHKAWILKW